MCVCVCVACTYVIVDQLTLIFCTACQLHRAELETKLGRFDMFTPILVRTQDVSVGTNFLLKLL